VHVAPADEGKVADFAAKRRMSDHKSIQ
jgi:hypothetical protein